MSYSAGMLILLFRPGDSQPKTFSSSSCLTTQFSRQVHPHLQGHAKRSNSLQRYRHETMPARTFTSRGFIPLNRLAMFTGRPPQKDSFRTALRTFFESVNSSSTKSDYLRFVPSGSSGGSAFYECAYVTSCINARFLEVYRHTKNPTLITKRTLHALAQQRSVGCQQISTHRHQEPKPKGA